MKLQIGKLVTVYNKLYKNALNLNAKMENRATLWNENFMNSGVG